jgi:hypothetical protein
MSLGPLVCGAKHEASGGKYVPRAVLFEFEPGKIGAVALSRRSAHSSARKISGVLRAGKNWEKGHNKRVKHLYFITPL